MDGLQVRVSKSWTDAKLAMDVQQAKHETGRDIYALAIEGRKLWRARGCPADGGISLPSVRGTCLRRTNQIEPAQR
jgi:hypothetical protein